MQIEIQLNESCTEPKIILQAAQLTDEIKELAQRLTVGTTWLAGFCGEQAVLLNPDELLREHHQEMSALKAFMYRNLGRHLMNRNVRKIRNS